MRGIFYFVKLKIGGYPKSILRIGMFMKANYPSLSHYNYGLIRATRLRLQHIIKSSQYFSYISIIKNLEYNKN